MPLKQGFDFSKYFFTILLGNTEIIFGRINSKLCVTRAAKIESFFEIFDYKIRIK